jgi:hypothetical protein
MLPAEDVTGQQEAGDTGRRGAAARAVLRNALQAAVREEADRHNARYRLDPDRAFAFLVRTSQNGNVRLREVAATLVADTTRQAE